MPEDEQPEDLSGWTVARMEARFTPKQAARIKWQVAALRLCTEPDAHLDALTDGDPGHRKAPRKPLPSGMGRNGSALTNMGTILTGVSGIL